MSGDPDWQVNRIEQALLHGPDWDLMQPGEDYAAYGQRVGPCLSPKEWAFHSEGYPGRTPPERALLDWYHCDAPHPLASDERNARAALAWMR